MNTDKEELELKFLRQNDDMSNLYREMMKLKEENQRLVEFEKGYNLLKDIHNPLKILQKLTRFISGFFFLTFFVFMLTGAGFMLFHYRADQGIWFFLLGIFGLLVILGFLGAFISDLQKKYDYAIR